MSNILTPLQAFKAMAYFFRDYYLKTSSDGLGSLLGDMQLFDDNTTWDPAAWYDWVGAMGGTEKQLTHLEAFTAMFNFLNAYHEMTSRHSVGVQTVLNDIEQKDGKPIRSVVWKKWLESIAYALKEEAAVFNDE